MCRDLEAAGFELSQTALYWCYRTGFPKGGDLSKMADAAAGAERVVVGPDRYNRNTQETGFTGGADYNITAPSTPLAVALDGWFTKGKVKPAVEVIIWARKPVSEKTELANMVRWGVGGVNCGACMVPFGEGGHPADMYGESYMSSGHGQPDSDIQSICGGKREGVYVNPAGRFPANLLCMDSALGDGSRYFDVDAWASEHGYTEDGWADAAAAGLLQVAKPGRSEKNRGCEGMDESDSGHRPNLRCLQCGKRQHSRTPCTCGAGEWEAIPLLPTTNPHPTCKPVRLFAYLLDFLCPPGGTVLDPFLGSGTTLVAAAQSARNGIGCELEEDYFAIAKARVAHAVETAAGVPQAQGTLDLAAAQ